MKPEKIALKYYIEYGLMRCIRFILLCLPIDIASLVTGKIWRFIAPFNKRHKRVLRHMEWALGEETSPKEREKYARDMWENLGRIFCEGLIADYIAEEKNRFDISHPLFKHWEEECQDGSLLITHHYGNWELVAGTVSLFTDHKMMGVYRRIKNPLVEEFMLNMRAPLFTGGLFSQAHGAARQAVASLRRGDDMSMVADLRDGQGFTINFFNMPAKVTSFPANLSVKFNKPIFAAQLRRTKGVNFVLDIQKIEIDKMDDKFKDEWVITQAIHKQFEDWIRQGPSQWMWAPYRWSVRRDAIKKPMDWATYQNNEKNAKKEKNFG